ncbi:Solute carrier family 7 member 13 [Aphelenchoides bicaudatus]|nr:Solute carrier family 7 member 13 [Aphelenchoides bicaudatus]
MPDEVPIDAKSQGSSDMDAEERREAAIEEITSVLGLDPAARNADHQMGLIGAISFVCGSIIGSGIFISPSTIIKETQSVGLSLLIWIGGAIISALGAYCYVEMGTSIRRSGSDFSYMHFMKLYPLAFSFGIITCFINSTSTIAIQAMTFAEYLRQGIRMKVDDPYKAKLYNVGISFTAVALLAIINFYSIRKVVARFQIVASFAKIGSTLLIICVGFYFLCFKGQTENLKDPFKNSQLAPGSLVGAFFAALLAFDGWDILNMGVEEVRNPRRTMPLAITVGMALVTVLFVLTNVAYSVVLTIPEIQESDAVAMKFADKAMGSFGVVVPFMICIVLIGSLNSSIFLGSRALHAIARSGLLPQFLSCWSHKRGSPRVAIVVLIFSAFCLAFSLDVRQLINYKGFSAWSQRTITIILLIYIRLSKYPVNADRIQTPIFMPFLFIIFSGALVITTVIGQTRTALTVLCILGACFLVYMVFVWEKALPRCSVYSRLRQKINAVLNKLCEIVFHANVDLHHKPSSKSSANSKSYGLKWEANKDHKIR